MKFTKTYLNINLDAEKNLFYVLRSCINKELFQHFLQRGRDQILLLFEIETFSNLVFFPLQRIYFLVIIFQTLVDTSNKKCSIKFLFLFCRFRSQHVFLNINFQESKSKILVNARKVRDPRVRDKLPKEITDILDKKESTKPTTTATTSNNLLSTEKPTGSKTPEQPVVSSQKSPEIKKSATPSRSPGQPESPTSTVNLSEEEKADKRSKEPPPPPSIREDLKKLPTKVSSSSSSSSSNKKSSSSSSSHHGSSGSRKRDRDHVGHRDSNKSSRKREESDKSPIRKREKGDETSTSQTSEDEKKSETTKVVKVASPESSSPSPPPVPPKSHSTKSQIHSRKPDPKRFRIPKKNKSRSPSPNSFKEEGPHVEFNGGRQVPKKRKDKTIDKRPADKKVKLIDEYVFNEDE